MAGLAEMYACTGWQRGQHYGLLTLPPLVQDLTERGEAGWLVGWGGGEGKRQLRPRYRRTSELTVIAKLMGRRGGGY